MYNAIIEIVKEQVGHEYLYLDKAVEVKIPGQRYAVRLWGVCVSPTNIVYVMNNEQEWIPLDLYEAAIVKAIYRRIITLPKPQTAVA